MLVASVLCAVAPSLGGTDRGAGGAGSRRRDGRPEQPGAAQRHACAPPTAHAAIGIWAGLAHARHHRRPVRRRVAGGPRVVAVGVPAQPAADPGRPDRAAATCPRAGERRPLSLDVAGALLAVSGSAASIYALTEGPRPAGTSARVLIAAAVIGVGRAGGAACRPSAQSARADAAAVAVSLAPVRRDQRDDRPVLRRAQRPPATCSCSSASCGSATRPPQAGAALIPVVGGLPAAVAAQRRAGAARRSALADGRRDAGLVAAFAGRCSRAAARRRATSTAVLPGRAAVGPRPRPGGDAADRRRAGRGGRRRPRRGVRHQRRRRRGSAASSRSRWCRR